jgi:hypothetical protein
VKEERVTTRDARARVLALCLLAAALVSTSSLCGIVMDDGGDPRRVISLRGQVVEIYGGRGLYCHDSIAKAVTFRGFDWANLLVCLPLLAVGVHLFRLGRLRGALILAAVFAYLAYNYLIGVMGNAWNGMFLVWTALFSTGLFGTALTLGGIDAVSLPETLGAAFPRRSLSVYMLVLAVALTSLYLTQTLTAYATGSLPAPLETYTTLELAALELGIMVPLHVTGGMLLWRRHAWGYLIAIPLAFVAAMTFIALSVGQVLLHVSFGRESISGIVQTVALALIASALSFLAFRRIRG